MTTSSRQPKTEYSDAAAAILPLIGHKVRVVHGPGEGEDGLHGSDVDCIVEGLDPNWPLRLPPGWRICQCLHYDLRSWYWVLDHEHGVLALDTTDDPDGLGRYGFPTSSAWRNSTESWDAIRASYLTSKRLRKGMRDSAEWVRIGELARTNPETYKQMLRAMFGRRVGSAITEVALNGNPPAEGLARAALRVQRWRRFRTPRRLLYGLAIGARRIWGRILHPTGLVVVIAGPDGSGKSTLAERLPGVCARLFRRHANLHWRPGVLPRPGAFLRREKADASVPHGRPSHPRAVSLVLLLYYWLDFMIGSWTRIGLMRRRTGLVVLERGWWDLIADPMRYRLRVSPRLVEFLGRLLPRPDVTLILQAESAVHLSRKHELPAEEIDRQSSIWAALDGHAVRGYILDASKPADQVADDARNHLVGILEARARSRLGAGWATLPSPRRPRWWIPRGPARISSAALAIYQPVTFRGRAGWETARLLARVGGMRLTLRSQAPPRLVFNAVAEHIQPSSSFAVARSNHPYRFVAQILNDDRNGVGFAKIAGDERGHQELRAEHEAIQALAPLLPAPLHAPKVIGSSPGVLLFESLTWRPRNRPWHLESEVAVALGQFFRAGSTNSRGPAHGDCAPWNLLRIPRGWVLIDWEDALNDAPPFFDVFHFLVQAHVLLRRPSRSEILVGLAGKGSVARTIADYAEGADIDPATAKSFLPIYLEYSNARLRESEKTHQSALARRRELLTAVRAK